MTTIYMHPTTNFERINLSDGSKAAVDVVKTPKGQRYQFLFDGHAHPNFWCDQPLENGKTINVSSIDGPEKFQIKIR